MAFNEKKIKLLLETKKWSYKDLAKKVAVAEKTIYNYLTGRSKIDVYTIERIAQVLGVPVSYFFDESPLPVQNIVNNVGQNNGKIVSVQKLENEVSRLKAELDGCKKELEAFKVLASEKDKRLEEKERFIKLLLDRLEKE